MNTANNKNVHYRTNSVKINDQIFLQIQKTLFWPTFGPFPKFWGQKKFFQKIGLSYKTS